MATRSFLAVVAIGGEVTFTRSRCGVGVWLLSAVAENEQVPGVLGVNLPVTANRKRRIGRSEGQLQEEPLDPGSIHVEHAGMALWDHICVSIFAFHIHLMVPINRRRIDAPLEVIRVIGNARQGSTRLAGLTVGLADRGLPGPDEV